MKMTMPAHSRSLPLLLAATLLLCAASSAKADWGIWDAGVFLRTNGGSLDYINATNFNASHIGDFVTADGDSLILVGGEAKTWKDAPASDVTGATFHYRVYPIDTAPGAFTEVNLPWFSDDGGNNNQTWQNVTHSNNVLASLTRPGTYRLEVYFSASGTNPDETKFYSNLDDNYIATFNYNIPVLEVNGINANYTTTKFFVDEEAADSFSMEIIFNPQATDLVAVEVFSNLNRRDYASQLWTNDQGVVTQEGLLVPGGHLITTNDQNRYYRAYPMTQHGANDYRLTLHAEKTGSYRLTARYKVDGDTNWYYYTDTGMGRRDHAVVVSPILARDMRVYEINVLNIDATGPTFAERSTFDSLLTSERWNLDYLVDLGANTLWFQPIHPNGIDGREPSGGWGDPGSPPYDPGSPYAVKNFFEVMEQMSDGNTRASSMTAFQNFVDAATARGVYIMLDAPFNHTSFDVEVTDIGLELFEAAGLDTSGWSADDEIRNREARFFSRNDGNEAYSGPASSAGNIATAPDRNDFGKWQDVADVFFGRYASLVTGYPDDDTSRAMAQNEGDWMNWDDLRGGSGSNGAVTRAVWEYFARYVPYWLEQTGLPFGESTETQTTGGIAGLRADFGQGMPPQFWEYVMNVARAHKWNFVFMSESLDGGNITYRSNRHFDILNENIVFPWQSANNTTAHRGIFEDRRAAYGQGLVLLNNTSHDEEGYEDSWQAFIRYAVGSTIDGAPMIMYGQEIGTGQGTSESGPSGGFDYFELNFGKYVPHFKRYNSMQPQWTAWANNSLGVQNLIPAYSGVGKARQFSPALRSSNRWFLNPQNSNDADETIFAVAKFETPTASPAVSDVVLAFVNLDRDASRTNTFGIPSGLVSQLGINPSRTYNVRNIAAYLGPNNEYPDRRDTLLWGASGRNGQDIIDNGVYVALNPVPDNDPAWATAPFEAQFLKLYDVTAPPALNTAPEHQTGKHYAIGDTATFTWDEVVDPEGAPVMYAVIVDDGSSVTTNFTMNTSYDVAGAFDQSVTVTVQPVNPHQVANAGGASPESQTVQLLDPDVSYDNTGVPAWQQDIAGTDPLDPDSIFKVTEAVSAAGDAERNISFMAQPGRTYRIYYTDDDLSSPTLIWNEFASVAEGEFTNTSGTEVAHAFVDDEGPDTSNSTPAGGKRFYRLEVFLAE